MQAPGPFRQSRVTSWSRRLRYWWSRLSGSRLQKSQTVALVDVNGRRFKRVTLRDSYLAAAIESALETFGASPHVPGLVIRYEHEVWVDFVEGDVPERASEELARALARFYAHVHSRRAREVRADDSVWPERLRRDLRFLAHVGVLDAAAHDALGAAAERLVPATCWIGFDYNDPVVKNFVRRPDGSLCGIDVESLVPDQLLGLGVAKALHRWMEPHRAAFFETYAASGAPDFAAYLPFVELTQLAAYTKLMFVERKWANVDATSFRRFAKDQQPLVTGSSMRG